MPEVGSQYGQGQTLNAAVSRTAGQAATEALRIEPPDKSCTVVRAMLASIQSGGGAGLKYGVFLANFRIRRDGTSFFLDQLGVQEDENDFTTSGPGVSLAGIGGSTFFAVRVSGAASEATVCTLRVDYCSTPTSV